MVAQITKFTPDCLCCLAPLTHVLRKRKTIGLSSGKASRAILHADGDNFRELALGD